MKKRHTLREAGQSIGIFVALCLIPAGCATIGDQPRRHHVHGEIIHLPSGSYGYLIKCGAKATSDCDIDAGKNCLELGYTVIDKKEPGPWFAFGNPLVVAMAEPKASLTIRCNTPNGLYPGDEARVR